MLVFLPAVVSAVLTVRFAQVNKDPSALISFGVALLVGLLVSFTKLESFLTAEGVSVRFFPFIRKKQLFPIEGIEKIEVVSYKPLREYGGWGLRIGKNGVAYSVSGKQGILITFKEPQKLFIGKHKTLLVGTQKPEAWREAIKAAGQ